MAGTRCVNPEYQLDVDTMMVEYVLYKGIEAHLQLLITLSEHSVIEQPHDISLGTEHTASGLRFTEMYDSLISLYKNKHGDTLPANTQRNGRILRFLVQLNSWVTKRIEHLKDLTPRVSKEMRERQQQEMIVNRSCRRIWLRMNQGSQSLKSDSEPGLWHMQDRRLSLAYHLLPLFIWISSDFFEISKTPRLSFEWMKLATQFMVQAAIDVLDQPDLLARGPQVALNALQECFAWGRLDDSRFPRSVDAMIDELHIGGLTGIDTSVIDCATTMEGRCQHMFRENSETRNGSAGEVSESGGQTPSWSSVKQEGLRDILMTFTSIQEAEVDLAHRPIELLRTKYPSTALLTDVNDFISVHWQLLHSRAWHGKPILVQIEEGDIDGLTSSEFEDFKERAALQDMWSPTLFDED